jgi:hypothetical protein
MFAATEHIGRLDRVRMAEGSYVMARPQPVTDMIDELRRAPLHVEIRSSDFRAFARKSWLYPAIEELG